MAEAIGETAALAKYPNVSVKLSTTPFYSSESYPFRDMTPHIRRLLDAFGPRRCYWGTDLTNSYSISAAIGSVSSISPRRWISCPRTDQTLDHGRRDPRAAGLALIVAHDENPSDPARPRRRHTSRALPRPRTARSDGARPRRGRCSSPQRIAGAWRPSKIYTSPMGRCVDTGAAIAKACGIAAEVCNDLNDIDYGAWQFKTFEDAKTGQSGAVCRLVRDTASGPLSQRRVVAGPCGARSPMRCASFLRAIPATRSCSSAMTA